MNLGSLSILAAADGQGGGGFVVAAAWCTLTLLACLPLATVLRARLNLHSRVAATVAERPWASLLLGAGNLVLVAVIGAAAGKFPVTGVLAALLALALLLAGFVGLLGVAADLGRRLYRDSSAGEGVGAFVLAWLLLAGVALFPVLGLFALLWFLSQGIGAAVLSAFRPGPSSAPDPRGDSPPPGSPD